MSEYAPIETQPKFESKKRKNLKALVGGTLAGAALTAGTALGVNALSNDHEPGLSATNGHEQLSAEQQEKAKQAHGQEFIRNATDVIPETARVTPVPGNSEGTVAYEALLLSGPDTELKTGEERSFLRTYLDPAGEHLIINAGREVGQNTEQQIVVEAEVDKDNPFYDNPDAPVMGMTFAEVASDPDLTITSYSISEADSDIELTDYEKFKQIEAKILKPLG